MANIGTKLYTIFFGKKAGLDEFGNVYYRGTKKAGSSVGRYNKERRWVVYKGKAEPSKVPAHWHGWLHYAFDEIPSQEELNKRQNWQKDHMPNLTGTNMAYYPSGHIEKGGKRDKSTGDYIAWKPE